MTPPATKTGHEGPPPSWRSAASAPPAESAEVLVANGLAEVLLVPAPVVGLPCVAVAFVAEAVPRELVEDEGRGELWVVVVDAAGPSLIVGFTTGGGAGRVGLPLVGGVFPLPKDQPSKPPTMTWWLIAPRLL
jgi:hypothetical protein